MKNRALLITAGVLAIILLLAVDTSAQSTSKIYGYVSVGGAFTNNANVTLAGIISGRTVTANDTTGHPGYYEFYVSNGSNYMVIADYGGHSAQHGYMVDILEVRIDLDISMATPTPTPTPVPTPIPRPSGELGGMVTRNDSSSFIPMSAHNAAATPTPKPSRAPTAAPTVEPTPTPAPAAGILSNIYLWLVIAIVAILAIAAALLLYMKK